MAEPLLSSSLLFGLLDRPGQQLVEPAVRPAPAESVEGLREPVADVASVEPGGDDAGEDVGGGLGAELLAGLHQAVDGHVLDGLAEHDLGQQRRGRDASVLGAGAARRGRGRRR